MQAHRDNGDTDFIHEHFHDQSCKKLNYFTAVILSM